MLDRAEQARVMISGMRTAVHVSGEQPGRFRAREDDSGRLFINRGTTANDQLKTFSVVDVSVGFCRNPPFRSRKPAGRLCAPILAIQPSTAFSRKLSSVQLKIEVCIGVQVVWHRSARRRGRGHETMPHRMALSASKGAPAASWATLFHLMADKRPKPFLPVLCVDDAVEVCVLIA